jgi:hypothetical protein
MGPPVADVAFRLEIRMTKFIVWGGAPAQHHHCFEAVLRTLKDIRQSDEWFGEASPVDFCLFAFYCSTFSFSGWFQREGQVIVIFSSIEAETLI